MCHKNVSRQRGLTSISRSVAAVSSSAAVGMIPLATASPTRLSARVSPSTSRHRLFALSHDRGRPAWTQARTHTHHPRASGGTRRDPRRHVRINPVTRPA